jgi:hypothetical protein
VRIQTQVPGPDGKLPYTGAIDCVKKTISREGPRALYKGMSAPLGGVVPIFSLCFLSYDAAKVGQALNGPWDEGGAGAPLCPFPSVLLLDHWPM